MPFSFGWAFITTATAPPPEDASTVVSSSACCAFAILLCSAWNCFIISGFIPRWVNGRLLSRQASRQTRAPPGPDAPPCSSGVPARVHPLQVERVVEADRQHVLLQRLHLTRGVEERRQLLIALPAGLAHPRKEAWRHAGRRWRRLGLR